MQDIKGNFVFLADRTDGLGARLLSVLNAFMLAEYYGVDCKIAWQEMKPGKAGRHYVPAADTMFTKEFIDEYCVDGDQLSNVVNFDSFLSGRKRISVSESDTVYLRTFWSLADEVKTKIGAEFIRESYIRNFKRIGFHHRFDQARAAAEAIELKPKTVAVHMRAGDVIYGRVRYLTNIVSKAVPYQLAAAFLERCKNEGSQAILFGQDRALYRALASQYGALIADEMASVSEWDETERELYEITLMSRCYLCFGGDSAFLKSAVWAGGKSELQIADAFSRDERRAIILGEETIPAQIHQAASAVQKSFSLWCLAIELLQDPLADIEALLPLAERGLTHSPDDPYWLFIRGCFAARSGKTDDAEALIGSAASKDGGKTMLWALRASDGPSIGRITKFLVPVASNNTPWICAFLCIERGIDSDQMVDLASLALSAHRFASAPWRIALVNRWHAHSRIVSQELQLAKARNDTLQKSILAVRGQPLKLQRKLKASLVRVEELKAKNAEIRQVSFELRVENQNISLNNKKLKMQKSEIQEKIKALNALNKHMERSLSWRMTAPVRWLENMFGRNKARSA